MSDDRLDCDMMSDVSMSDASWADAQADTPTMGKEFSDSEDTLSNLSFDNELVLDNGTAAAAGSSSGGADVIPGLVIDNSTVVPSSSSSTNQLFSKDKAAATAVGTNRADNSLEDILPLPELLGQLNKSNQKTTQLQKINSVKISDQPPQLLVSTYKSDEDSSSSTGFHVQVCVTTADVTNTGTDGKGPSEFQLNLPPGVSYEAPSVDFPSSPSQLKFSQGESFMPKEDSDPGLLSEDDTSFASSCRAQLDLNLQNGDVHLRKKARPEQLEKFFSTNLPLSITTPSNKSNKMASIPSFEISNYCDEDSSSTIKTRNNTNNNNNKTLYNSLEPESLIPIDSNNEELDDYMEDFYLPISNESVMSRQTSFRRKVQKQLETAAAETAINELNKFERMLSSYDEEPEHELNSEEEELEAREEEEKGLKTHPKSSTPTTDNSSTDNAAAQLRLEQNSHRITFGRGKDQVKDRKSSKVNKTLNFEDPLIISHEEPESILDIDAICQTHAPNLMSVGKCDSDDRSSSTSEIVEYDKFQPRTTTTTPKVNTAINNNLTAAAAADCEGEPQSLLMTTIATNENGDYELESGYFLQKSTVDKLASVYDLTNFTNLYTLSGELKHILSPIEIEELVTNRIHLENIIDPKVMAALSWSLNEISLPMANNNNNSNNSDADSAIHATECLHQDEEKLSPTNSPQPQLQLPSITIDDSNNGRNLLGSKNSSISAGFHSQSPSVESLNSDEHSDLENEIKPTIGEMAKAMNHNNNKASEVACNNKPVENLSLRRKISIEDASITSDLPKTKYTEAEPVTLKNTNNIKDIIGSSSGNNNNHSRNNSNESGSGSGSESTANVNESVWKSLETLGNLKVEDYEIESGNESDNTTPKVFLVRRDSKRFNKRSVQGLFVESKNGSSGGTLRRIKAPLHLSEDYTVGTDETGKDDSLESNITIKTEPDELVDEVKHLNVSNKKRISVDEKILSAASDLDDTSQATDVTQSDVFHSFITSFKDEDPTIKSEFDDDDEDEVDEITLDLDTTPDDEMDGSILGNIEDIESITPPPRGNNGSGDAPDEEFFEDYKLRSFRIGANDVQIDMKAIEPYRRVLSHGGYFDAEQNVSIILFSGCYLPDRSRKEYSHLMDHLFLYVLSGLEELISHDYILVYLHGATPRSCQPSFGWLKRCYQLIDRKLRKNLKSLYLVHPTFWLRTVVTLTRPFISSKFSQKIQFVNTLAELCLEIPTEHLVIPEKVLQYDFDMKIAQLKKQDQLS